MSSLDCVLNCGLRCVKSVWRLTSWLVGHIPRCPLFPAGWSHQLDHSTCRGQGSHTECLIRTGSLWGERASGQKNACICVIVCGVASPARSISGWRVGGMNPPDHSTLFNISIWYLVCQLFLHPLMMC